MNIYGAVWDNYLSDIERECSKLDKDDVLLIAGDISWAMTLEQAIADLEFIGSLNGTKVIIKGNHDYWWKSISAIRNVLPEGVFALQNDCLKIGNYLFTGSRGWMTPEPGVVLSSEDQKIYNREICRFELGLKAAQKQRESLDKLIVLCHYPPFNSTFKSNAITDLFSEYNADAVVYGHLHGANIKFYPKVKIDGIPYYLSSCDLLHNKPVLVELKNSPI